MSQSPTVPNRPGSTRPSPTVKPLNSSRIASSTSITVPSRKARVNQVVEAPRLSNRVVRPSVSISSSPRSSKRDGYTIPISPSARIKAQPTINSPLANRAKSSPATVSPLNRITPDFSRYKVSNRPLRISDL